MSGRPELWPLARVASLPREETMMWVTPSALPLVRATLPFAVGAAPSRNLVVVGGGTMLDEAKRLVHDEAPGARLIAIPSVWGSGAEASPVVVLNRDGKKEIRMGEEYLPHARAVWPELASTLTEERAREACGDAWAHAAEGYLSPLATEELRAAIAELMGEMIAVGIGNDPRWFDLSARAAAAQARSSVGLVHGVAHTLEPLLGGWGHARLCSTYLAPVLRFDLRSEKVKLPAGVEEEAAKLFDAGKYRQTLPALEAAWRDVLRDRCTRTNATLVRPADLQFFLHYA
jgi:alcohol dehydrogenase class IV